MSKGGTLTTVGGLLPRDLLDRVAAGDSTLPGSDPTTYDLVPGERLNDAVTRSWNRLRTIWDAFKVAEAEQPESDLTAATVTRERWLMPLLNELGFAGGIESVRGLLIDGKGYAISHQWQSQVTVHLPGARVPIDRISRGVQGAATSSPHGLMQEFLNRSDEHLWGILSNGRQLRLLRDNASLTRQAYVEFDLEAMFDGDAYADFVVLWLTCHRSRFEADVPEKCLLEQWSNEAATAGTRALDKLRDGVEAAIKTIGEGFLAHPANNALRESLRNSSLTTTEYHHQLLRTIYRLLFLLVAESRELLLDPAADATTKARYNDFYSLTRARTLSTKRRGTVHDDLWQAINVVFGALGHDGLPALGIKPLGSFLWSSEATNSLAGARLDNRHLLEALRHLGQVNDSDSRLKRSVDYRNLGAEELGSIYESLLELHPEIDVATRTFTLNTAAGNERKTTGSYYTPTSLINELLDSALEPVLREAARKPDAEAAILGLSVIDPACGSGHFLIAAANRIAHRLASVRGAGAEPSPRQVRAALRDVVGRCIHGIDLNPMAVELCKVSLWLEAMEPGKPLSFLEHRIVCGNALLGTTPRLLAAGVPDDAYKPLIGDDRKIATALRKRNKSERAGGQGTQGTLDLVGFTVADAAVPIAEAIARIDELSDDTVEQLEEKQRLLDELEYSGTARRAGLAADAWCAAFVAPKAQGEPPITTATVSQILESPDHALADVVDRIDQLAKDYRFLHLHLAFPDVIAPAADPDFAVNERTGWAGGFDVVLGNPPWERVKLQEKEWFAVRDSDIANAPNAASRKKRIAALETESPELFEAFQSALRQAEGESHLLRNSGRYPLCGRGDVNTYTVFSEAMRDAAGPTGRVGVIVPSGIATDDTTKFFFQDLVETRSLASLSDFANSKPMFVGVHRGYRFCLLTMTGPGDVVDSASFVFGANDVSQLAEEDRGFTLEFSDFALLNPNTRTCPTFGSRKDAELTKAIYRRIPVLDDQGSSSEDKWGVQLWSMFHMSGASGRFVLGSDLRLAGAEVDSIPLQVPSNRGMLDRLFEAKMFWIHDHRAADVILSETATTRQGQSSRLSGDDHLDPNRFAIPRFWIESADVDDAVVERCQSTWFLGWRDVTAVSNERTLVPAVGPRGGYGDKFLLIDVPESRLASASLLYAALSSFVVDFVCRQKISSTSVKLFHMRQLPIIAPSSDVSHLLAKVGGMRFVRDRVVELCYTSWELRDFAIDMGLDCPPFVWNPDRRRRMAAELDALMFHLYGLAREEVEYVMDSFTIVRRRDIEQHGEYVSRDLIVDAYVRLARSLESEEHFETSVDPIPASRSVCHELETRPSWAEGPEVA